MSPPDLVRSVRDSRGAVLVFVALTLPVLIGVGGLIVDVGNWYSHKRHLQVQADAGALAGAGKFRIPCNATVDAAIKNEAALYSSVEYTGPGYTPGPGYNPQTGGTPPDQLHRRINSKTFYSQAAPVDDTVQTGEPCAAKMIDVKLTETNLPWYLKAAQVPFINAHARVEIKKKLSSAGALPVGVPEVGPQKAKALFVDESTGNVIASKELSRKGTLDGLAIWSNSTEPVSVPVTEAGSKIGVRIALSGSASLQCGDPLVDCYGAGTSAAIVPDSPGLVKIRGYDDSTPASASAPRVRDVDLLGDSCENGYFTTLATADPCTVDVAAVVDFGPTPPPLATTRVLALRSDANANTAVDLTAPATYAGSWTGGAIEVDRGEGAVSIALRWQTGCPTTRSQPCNRPSNQGTLGGVHRVFAGDESLAVSGPIKSLSLFENSVSPANSFPSCDTCRHDLVVRLGVKANLLPAQGVGDPLVTLKVAGGGSQNQALDCDPSKPNVKDELATGCTPRYAVNDGAAACPGSPTTLWNSPQEWKCVAVNTGATVGQVTQGLNQRILGAAINPPCNAPNNWASYPNLPAGDPRIVSVFLTPFGAFTGTGSNTVPVIGFADFYVTGWDNGGCQGAGDDPAGQGAIVGHYIKHIENLGNGGGGEEFCDFDSLGSCVAEFTR